MKFAYIELSSQENRDEEIPGREIAELICRSLDADGPFERGDYGWEWTFRGSNYKAQAVLQSYENGWLIPVDVGFFDRVLKRGATMLVDLSGGIEKALGPKLTKILTFKSEQEFNDSGI